jgi:hypothetical protein
MSKPIKSTDPRKPAIVAALKRASNCRKVTSVRQIGESEYAGDCMNPNAADSRVGTVTVIVYGSGE